MSNAYQHRYPVNTLQVITEDFLEGAPFTEQLCDKIITGFSATPTEAVSYKRHMEFVKQIVSRAKHIKANGNVYALETNFEFSELELALVIRLLNLAHHGQCILVLNDNIIYIPKNLRAMDTETLRVYVYKTIKGLKPSRFKVWKENFKERIVFRLNSSVLKNYTLRN